MLITLHRSGNYGSVLQAYATQTALERLGYDVEVIDYYPRRLSVLGMLTGLKTKKACFDNPLILLAARLVILPSYLRRRYVFNRYIGKNLNLTSKTYFSEGELEAEVPVGDIYLTGGDQVWNSSWNGCFDRPFYLEFAPDESPKFSFGSSFGKDDLFDWERDDTARALSRYSGIAVREDTAVTLLESLGVMEACQALDPVFLLDVDDWKRQASTKYSGSKYILMYNINGNKPLDCFASKLAKETGLGIRYISYQYHDVFKNGKMHCCPAVEDFLSLLANAAYVVTDSFHCTAFSILLQKEFAVVPTTRFGGRLYSLMRLFGLQNRIVGKDDTSVFESPIDYESVDSILKHQRGVAFDYLKSMDEAVDAARCEVVND